MNSPFPGMDPYIEACGLWGDFHSHLIDEMYRQLADAVPQRYVVRSGERSYLVFVEDEGKTTRPFVPDVSLVEPRTRKRPGKKKNGGGVAVAVPETSAETMRMRIFVDDEYREAFVEIYEVEPEMRLVTCIEALSPSNKRPGTPGWDQYLRKRQSVVLSGVNLVEIDLLRGSQRMPMLDPWPDSPYTLLVARPNKKRVCEVWPAYFQQRLPVIPVPLAAPDPDLSLDLQPLIESIYQRSRYARSIDYARPLTPPLSAEEAAWLRQRLKARKAALA